MLSPVVPALHLRGSAVDDAGDGCERHGTRSGDGEDGAEGREGGDEEDF